MSSYALFTYVRYTKANTPAKLYCNVCRRGFLSPSLKQKHSCASKRLIKGRFKCKNCLFETESRTSIEAHVSVCKFQYELEDFDLIERVMNSSNTEQIRLCPFCNKGFSPESNFREKHITECEKNKYRCKVNTTEWECKICGKKYLLKQAAISHVQTVHQDQSDEVRGGGGGKKSIPKFRYRAVDVELHTADLNDVLISNHLYSNSIDIVKDQLKDSSLKAYPIFRFIVVKRKGLPDENIFSLYFSVEITLIHIANYKSIVKHWTDIGLVKFDQSQNLGSGFELIELHSVSIMMYQFRSEIGKGDPIIPSIFFKNDRIVKIVNVPRQNVDCFHICICAADLIYHRRKCGEKPFLKPTTRKLRKESGNAIIDFSSLNLKSFSELKLFSPMKISDLSKVEKYVKPFTFNVYLLEVYQKPEKVEYSLRTLFVSRNHLPDEERIINILFFDGHFFLINKLTNLIEKIQGRRHRTSNICYNCQNPFDERYTNIKEHLKQCILGVKTNISYPQEGEKKEFNRFELSLLKPYFAVSDFECSLLEVEKKEFEKTEKTKRLRKHSVNSVCVVIYTDENLDYFPYKDFEKYRYYYDRVKDDSPEECERLMKDFIIHLNKCAQFFVKWIDGLDPEEQISELKKIHFNEYNKCTKCMFCKKMFADLATPTKVFHHDHFRREYIGALCANCNFKARKTTHLDVFFHNASYDSNFILENLNFSEFPLEDKGWRCSMKGQKISLMCGKLLKFRDSYALLPLSLAKLAKKLKESDCIYQRKYLPFSPRGKQIFPYNYISTVARFDEKKFPDKDHFNNDLGDGIDEEAYNSAKSFFDEKFATIGEWNKYYVTMDVLCAIDVLISMRNYLFKIVGLDLLSAYSLPDLALNGLLLDQLGKQELKLVSSPDMYDAFLKATKGGISWAALRHHNIPEKRREKEHLLYLDLKSSYPHAFTYPLPVGEWKYIDINEPTSLIKYMKEIDMTQKGCLVKIDCFSPKETHDYLNDLPVIISKTSFDASYYPKMEGYRNGNNVEKLIGHLGPAKEEFFTCHELLVMLELGVVITKVYTVIEYSAKDFAYDFITRISNERQRAILEDNESLSFIIKTFLNSIFGKCLLDKLKYNQVNIVTSEAQLEKRVRNIRFKAATVQKYSALVTSHQRKAHLDSLVHVGCAILGISKMVLIKHHYTLKKYIHTITYITPKPSFRSLYFDTDSCIILIKGITKNELYGLFKDKMENMFDWSNLPISHPLYNEKNRFKIGVLKNETEGREVQEVNALGSKVYDVIFFPDQIDENGDECSDMNKCKGVPKFLSGKFSVEDYRQSHKDFASANANVCINAEIPYFVVEPNMRKTYTYSISKRVLNPYDRKRYVLPNSFDSLSLNHFRIPDFQKKK